MSFESLPSFAKQTTSVPVSTPVNNYPTTGIPDPLAVGGGFSMSITGWLEIYDDKENDRVVFFRHQDIQRIEIAQGYMGIHFPGGHVDVSCNDSRTLAQMVLAQQTTVVRKGENKVNKVIVRGFLPPQP